MNMAYEDRSVLGKALAKEVGASASAAGGSSKSFSKGGGRCNIREPDFVRIGREMAKPVGRKSWKVSFVLGEFTDESFGSEVVSL